MLTFVNATQFSLEGTSIVAGLLALAVLIDQIQRGRIQVSGKNKSRRTRT